MRNRNGQISKSVRVDCNFAPASQHDVYFLRGRVGVGNFLTNKFLHDKNCSIKSCNWSHRADNRENALYYPGPVFDLKKCCTSYCPTKKNNSKLIKMRKNSDPPKIALHPPAPFKK